MLSGGYEATCADLLRNGNSLKVFFFVGRVDGITREVVVGGKHQQSSALEGKRERDRGEGKKRSVAFSSLLFSFL